MKNSKDLTKGDIPKTILSLATPMFLGLIAIMLFQLADTYYVGQLGADQLAAMGFIFPIVFIIHALTFGIGGGVTTVVSIALGEKNFEKVKKITTHAIFLALCIIIPISILGFHTIEPVFSILGAKGHILGLISQYMTIYFLTVFLLMLPMVGNSAIRGTGDTKTPAVIMTVAAITNIILDPIFIFGFGPVPALGLQGAAIATSIAWAMTFIASFCILGFRLRILDFNHPNLSRIKDSWEQILHIGFPAAGASLLAPLLMGVITRIVADFGNEAVAGFGVGSRVESLAMIGIMSLGAAVSPFVGQNYGAKEFGRIKSGVNFALKASAAWGVGSLLFLFLFAKDIAFLFNTDPKVVQSTILFLQILPIAYWAWGVGMIIQSSLYSLKKPMDSAILLIVRLAVLMIPSAYIGAQLFGLSGLFFGLVIAQILGAGVAYQFFYKRVENELLN